MYCESHFAGGPFGKQDLVLTNFLIGSKSDIKAFNCQSFLPFCDSEFLYKIFEQMFVQRNRNFLAFDTKKIGQNRS